MTLQPFSGLDMQTPEGSCDALIRLRHMMRQIQARRRSAVNGVAPPRLPVSIPQNQDQLEPIPDNDIANEPVFQDELELEDSE